MCIRDRYNTDEKNEVDGRILLIKDSNVTDIIEGDLFNTSVPVSYTHLDVYKRQVQYIAISSSLNQSSGSGSGTIV